MTPLPTLFAALERVNHAIATAPNSVALGELLTVRRSIRQQIQQARGK